MGTFTKKTHRQVNAVTRKPPSTGPMAGAMVVGTVRMLAARTRSEGREDAVEHGHADGSHHSAARPLNDPEGHELADVLGQTAQPGPHGEHHDGDQEHPFPTEVVTEPPRRRDEDGQAHQVGDDDAVDGGRGDREVAADRGQGDVHDRDVHDAHEHGRDEHGADGELLAHASFGHVFSGWTLGRVLVQVQKLGQVRSEPGAKAAVAVDSAPRPYALARPDRPRARPAVTLGWRVPNLRPVPTRGREEL